MKPNYGTIIDPEKFYPVSYTITQGGKKIYKKGKLKGCDLTENQVKELLSNPKAKIIISHGGARKGAGAKKKPNHLKKKSKVMRIPLELVSQVKALINHTKPSK